MTEQGEAPEFQAYFDPAVDAAAAVVHSFMGDGAAVLFGTTGQTSGGYAALAVGISAPMLLTQLGRIETVNQLVTGGRQPADAEGAGAPSTEHSAILASAVGLLITALRNGSKSLVADERGEKLSEDVARATVIATETVTGSAEPATRHRLPISYTMKIARQCGRLRCGPCADGRG
ncbi:hypothetical protein [Streptomyces sp. NPDC057966]|uniref:hypothetical protein n=1 Tax=Streptomyces sp. NPDC057966 TaxID=3346292 RepID=UPI0036E403DE